MTSTMCYSRKHYIGCGKPIWYMKSRSIFVAGFTKHNLVCYALVKYLFHFDNNSITTRKME